MAKKNSTKQGKDFFDTRSGRVFADFNFADHRTSVNPKSEIAFIREAFPLRSKSDITLVLQSCDFDVEAAIASFTNGEADNLLKEWNTQGKKSKNVNSAKKKRNKKKQTKNDEPDSLKDHAVEKKSEKDLQLIENGHEDVSARSEEKPTPASSLTLECPSSSTSLLHPPSPSNSEISLPSSTSDVPTDAIQDPELPSKNSSDSPTHSPSTHAKFERTMSTGPDALKKTVKDLQRSSVTLPRFQLLLEEECEKSFKSMAETFKELRQSLNDREAQLLAQMEEFKKQAVESLEQRQENAAALKLKSDRVGGMPEAEVTQLRNEIKHFVTERKIDEELARTTRFVGDKDQLLTTVKNFGEVVPIKSCYSPVMLNPPPLPTKKVEQNKQNKKTTEPVKPVTLSASTSTTVPTITAPAEDKSASSHKALQEVAQLHARLQEALRQQGLSSSTGKPGEGPKQSRPDNKKDRPNSAPQTLPQRQASSRRPQTARPQNQQQRKDHNPQQKDSRSPEPRGSQQGSNQSYRNSRRANQRQQPTPRNIRPESSNDKHEVPKEEAVQSSEKTQQQPKLDKEKHLESDVEKVELQQSGSSNKEHAQAGNRNQQARTQRDGGDERPRNRNRRRGGRRGAAEGQHERGPYKDSGEKSKNGPFEKDLPEKGPVEKSVVANEKKKATVKEEEADHDIKMRTVNGNKDDSPVANNVEHNNGASKSQDVAIMNGKKTETVNNSSDCLNGEKALDGDSKIKEALPQRPDRASRRRGAQNNRKGGPSFRPAPQRHLNGAKPAENGVGDSHGENSSHVQDEKLPVVAKETKINSHTAQEREKDIEKSHVPKVNGYIPVKELNGVSIDR